MAPSRAWRLIEDGPGPGARNMALDRAVLDCVAEGSSPPTLRLYRWETPTLSLGRFQGLEGIDLDACERHGADVVRRPTGGRGVLHDDELTYSLTAALADGVPCGTAASYAYLSEPLRQAYASLGVDAELTRRDRGDAAAAACYLHTTRADLTAGAAKLSGSAQVWCGEAVLQHGSFVRSRDLDREREVFGLDAAAADALARTTATLSSLLGEAPAVETVAAAIADAVSRAWGVTLEAGGYTEREIELATSHQPRFGPLRSPDGGRTG